MNRIAPQPDFINTEPSTTTNHFSRRLRPIRPPVNDHLFKARIRRQAAHLHELGVRPLTEFLVEFVGLDEQARNDLLLLLERYSRLDRAIVEAVGADSFPPILFAVKAP